MMPKDALKYWTNRYKV